MKPHRRKNRLKFLLLDIITLGKYDGKHYVGMTDQLIRIILLNGVLMFGFFLFVVLAVVDIRIGASLGAIICSVMASICVVIFIIGRTNLPLSFSLRGGSVLYGVLCVLIVFIGDAQGINFVYIYLYPSLTIFMVGMQSGIIMSLVLIAIISLELLIPGFSRYSYDFDVSIRILAAYIIVFFVMIVVETTRKTKDKQIESQNQRLKELKDEAEEANKSKSNFLAIMSHEIRTPLNAILGIAQIQMQEDDLPNKYADAFDKIQNSGNALLGIINDILDLSKIETGKLELNPVDYDIPSLINDTMQLNAVRIGSKPIEFMLEIDENLPSILYGDELRIKQILNNLLSNAVKYTEKGSIVLSVSAGERSTNSGEDNEITLVFSVSDTGQGMKNEDMERLFTEYLRFNTDANRSTEGTGLGLTITKRLLTMMNGNISVESKYGTGSIFTATVTQKVVDATPIGRQVAENLRNFSYVDTKSKQRNKVLVNPMPYGSVLVVDDVESNLLVAKGLLSPYKLKIETADSGFAAIEKIANGKTYDVIFMDHMMPKMDGIETTQKLRKQGYKGVIVALTANALVGNDVKFSESGFDGYISKPIDIWRLDAVLNKFIRDQYPEEAKKYKPETVQTQKLNISTKHMEIFLKEAKKAVITLRETTVNGDIKLFTTTVHALKTSLNYIGEKELSQKAASLEAAGSSGDTGFIAANTEGFIETLEALIKTLTDTLPSAETAGTEESQIIEDTAFLSQQLAVIKAACEDYDDTAAYAALDSLKLKPWKRETSDALESIRDTLFLDSDFEEAGNKVSSLMESVRA